MSTMRLYRFAKELTHLLLCQADIPVAIRQRSAVDASFVAFVAARTVLRSRALQWSASDEPTTGSYAPRSPYGTTSEVVLLKPCFS